MLRWSVLAVVACGAGPVAQDDIAVPELLAKRTFKSCAGVAATCDTFSFQPATQIDLMLTPLSGDPHLASVTTMDACLNTATFAITQMSRFAVVASAKNAAGNQVGTVSGIAVDFSFPNTTTLTTTIDIAASLCN